MCFSAHLKRTSMEGFGYSWDYGIIFKTLERNRFILSSSILALCYFFFHFETCLYLCSISVYLPLFCQWSISVYLSVFFVSVYLSVFFFVRASASTYLTLRLFSVHRSMSLFIHPSYPSIYPSVFSSIHLCISPSFYPSVYPSVYQSFFLPSNRHLIFSSFRLCIIHPYLNPYINPHSNPFNHTYIWSEYSHPPAKRTYLISAKDLISAIDLISATDNTNIAVFSLVPIDKILEIPIIDSHIIPSVD